MAATNHRIINQRMLDDQAKRLDRMRELSAALVALSSMAYNAGSPSEVAPVLEYLTNDLDSLVNQSWEFVVGVRIVTR